MICAVCRGQVVQGRSVETQDKNLCKSLEGSSREFNLKSVNVKLPS